MVRSASSKVSPHDGIGHVGQHVDVLRALAGEEEGHLAGRAAAEVNPLGLQNAPLARVVLRQRFQRKLALLDQLAAALEGDDQTVGRVQELGARRLVIGQLAGLGRAQGLLDPGTHGSADRCRRPRACCPNMGGRGRAAAPVRTEPPRPSSPGAAVNEDGTCTMVGRLVSRPGTCSSTTTWKLVPPNPKADTPQRRGPNAGLSHGRALVLTSNGILSNGMFGFGSRKLSDGGRILWWQASTALSKLAAPAALFRCPICDLTEPSAIRCLTGRAFAEQGGDALHLRLRRPPGSTCRDLRARSWWQDPARPAARPARRRCAVRSGWAR